MSRFFRFLAHEKWALFGSVLLIGGMQFIEYHGWLAGPEGMVLDLFLRHAPGREATSKHRIATLEIDEDAYQECFCAKSPMNPATIEAIVSKAAADGPAVIGIDVLTDSPAENYGAIRAQLSQGDTSSFHGKAIVWAAAVERSSQDPLWFGSWLLGADRSLVIQPSRVLGESPRDPEAPDIHWAIPAFPREEDLRLRRLPRQPEVLIGQSPVPKLSWASRIAKTYCETQGRACNVKDQDDVFLSFDDAGITRLSLKCVPRPNCRKETTCPDAACQDIAFVSPTSGARADTSLKDAVVLIGGTFRSGRDDYDTPKGSVPGLLINAYAVRAEIDGSGASDASRLFTVALDAAIALGIVAIFSRRWLSVRGMILLSFLLIPAVACLSAMAFWFGYVWLSCIGVAVGLMPHVILEIARMNPEVHHGD